MQVASGALVPVCTKQLVTYCKRWITTDRLAQAKRRDFRESERLRMLEQEEALKEEAHKQPQGWRQQLTLTECLNLILCLAAPQGVPPCRSVHVRERERERVDALVLEGEGSWGRFSLDPHEPWHRLTPASSSSMRWPSSV